jgi:hypothetical protein
MIRRIRATSSFDDGVAALAALVRSCPLSGGRLAIVATLLSAAAVLTALTGLLLMAALLVAADAVVPHPARPDGDAADRFRRLQRARRRDAARHRLARTPEPQLDVLDGIGAGERRALGVRPIAVASVTSTVEPVKARQFDAAFRPDRGARDRWQAVWAAQARGVALPPIEVYRLEDGCHAVIDGHHRVSVARDQGLGTIDADVVELRRTR